MKWFISLIILFPIIVIGSFEVFSFWAQDPLNLRAPSDQKLISLFLDHRAAFETLRQMLKEDKIDSVSQSDSDRLSMSRKKEYERLVEEIYPSMKVYNLNYEPSLTYLFADGGDIDDCFGWMKGIKYVSGNTENLGHITQNLDEARCFPPGMYLRQIEPHWFIFYAVNDDSQCVQVVPLIMVGDYFRCHPSARNPAKTKDDRSK